jgi:ankyrin repeat protein
MRSWEDYKKTMKSESPIFDHARNGDVAALRMTITADNLNERNHKGHSALMLAAYNGNIEATEWLIQAGAQLNEPDNNGGTILMGAAFKGHLEIVQMLIDAGADIEAKNPQNQTALDFAQMFGRTSVVHYLKKQQNQPEVFGLIDALSSWKSYLAPKRRSL